MVIPVMMVVIIAEVIIALVPVVVARAAVFMRRLYRLGWEFARTRGERREVRTEK